MIMFEDVRNHAEILECIRQSDKALEILGYTDHGLRHLDLVAKRGKNIAEAVGLSKRDQELSAIACFCHDMGNFLGRTNHHYWGSLLFHQIFRTEMKPAELMVCMQAIANHDKTELKFTNAVSAVVVLADKSDVHRSRVRKAPLKEIRSEIHSRVNYGATYSELSVNQKEKTIILRLNIDTDFVAIIEYFEIFTERMTYCRTAAKYLKHRFELIINDFQLL